MEQFTGKTRRCNQNSEQYKVCQQQVASLRVRALASYSELGSFASKYLLRCHRKGLKSLSNSNVTIYIRGHNSYFIVTGIKLN